MRQAGSVGRLLLLFVVLPAVELALLIEIGSRIGTLETIGLIVVTGVLGAAMARSQGLRVLASVREQLAAGELPADSLIDGLMILIASALLVTPGVLTDAFGLLCLVPGFRSLVKRELLRRLKRAIEEQRVEVRFGANMSFGESTGSGLSGRRAWREARPVVDVTPRSEADEPRRPAPKG